MPTFTVKGPDGRNYRVNAPKGATAEQAIAYVQKNHPAPAPRTGAQTVGDFAGDMLDNITPNWGDEIYGAANWAAHGGHEGSFHDGQQYFKRTQAQYDKEHPALAWGSTIAGTVAGMAAPVGELGQAARLAKGAGKLRTAARAAKVGAIYGAVSGAGDGDSLGDRATNAVKGAAIGGTVGAVMPSVVNGVVRGGRFIRSAVPGVDPALAAAGNVVRRVRGLPVAPPHARAQAHADSMIADRLNGDDHIIHGPGQPGPAATPQSVAAEVTHRASMGVPAMPADVSENLRGLTSWASRGQGPGQTAVRQALAARKAGEGARVRQHIVDTMGPTVDPIAAVQDNLKASKQAAGPLYAQAYAQPTQVTPEIAQIMETPAFKDAVPTAIENIRNNRGDPHTMGFLPTPDGGMTAGKQLTTEGYDQVVRAMQQNARSRAAASGGINPLTGAVTHNSNSVGVQNAAMDLRTALTAQNDPLRQAVEGYAEEAGHRQAMEAGAGVAKQTGHEINDLSRTITPDAHQSYAQGARTALADQASTHGAQFPNGDTSVSIRKALGDDAKQAALENIMGNQGSVPALQQRLEAEQQGNIVTKEVLGGSPTRPRAALDDQLDGELNHSMPSSFSLPGIAKSAVSFIANKAATPYRNEVKRRIAEVVTATNPTDVQQLMAEIAHRAQQDQRFARLMHQSGVIGAGLYGRNIKPDVEATDQPDQ